MSGPSDSPGRFTTNYPARHSLPKFYKATHISSRLGLSFLTSNTTNTTADGTHVLIALDSATRPLPPSKTSFTLVHEATRKTGRQSDPEELGTDEHTESGSNQVKAGSHIRE